MTKSIQALIAVVLMLVVIVPMDLLFFRDKFLPRLLANIAVVLLFAVVYWLSFKRS